MLITEIALQANTIPFLALLKPNVALHAAIERDVQGLEFGTITYTFQIKDGKVDLKSLNTVMSRRYKY
jgi:hypothetical protein